MGLILPPGFGRDLPYYDLKFDRAENYPPHYERHRELGRDAPVFVAKIRMDAPHPDVQVVLPVRPQAIVALQRGDPSVLPALTDELISAHRRVLQELRG